jgi:predicted ATPase with chaperone activity
VDHELAALVPRYLSGDFAEIDGQGMARTAAALEVSAIHSIAGALDHAVSLGTISQHAAGRALRVTWTIAYLAGRDRPGRDDCELALAFSTGAIP